MTLDQKIAIGALVATIFFGVVGLFVAKKIKSNARTQRQSVENGGIAIQSGRDTKIEK